MVDYAHITQWMQQEDDRLLYTPRDERGDPLPDDPLPATDASAGLDTGETDPPLRGAALWYQVRGEHPADAWSPEERARRWPDPTPEELTDPLFAALWDVIRTWDIGVPEVYAGHCGATGNHVVALMAALRGFTTPPTVNLNAIPPRMMVAALGRQIDTLEAERHRLRQALRESQAGQIERSHWIVEERALWAQEAVIQAQAREAEI